MVKPTTVTVLMIEVEPGEGISSRKLVLETAKRNVITAYSAEHGIELLHRFPNVDAVIVHSKLDEPYTEVVKSARALLPRTPIILLSPTGTDTCSDCTAVVSSHDPRLLLDTLEKMFPSN